FLGLGLHTTRAHLVRAVLEGIAMRVAQVVCAMKEHLQTQPQGIKVDGGLSASRVLMQMQSDLLGMPLEVAQDGEATQKGVCYVAALATNLWKDLSEIPSSQPSAVYRPRTSKQQREVARDRFQRAIQLLQGWHTP
ncbi:MAG: hypothetical protein HY537_09275, partial [Deltaproteobacteria bacterium]|nr:hypothetical protein [Deltaproteobacteria bacterium]